MKRTKKSSQFSLFTFLSRSFFILGLAFVCFLAVAVQADTLVGEGKASWIGERFQGKPTASGEPFDMNEYVASHATLPLGSKVRVTSKKTNKSVIVRINNRSEIDNGRMIDLSRKAAQEIGLIDEGIGMVKVELLSANNTQSNLNVGLNTGKSDKASTQKGSLDDKYKEVVKYQLQYGSFFELENAQELQSALKSKKIETSVETNKSASGKTVYKVIGSKKYDSKELAKASLASIAPQEAVVQAVSSKVPLEQANNANAGNLEYAAQFGAFSTELNAKQLQQQLLADKGMKTIIHQFPDDERKLYRVLTDKPFSSKKALGDYLEAKLDYLSAKNIKAVVLTFVK